LALRHLALASGGRCSATDASNSDNPRSNERSITDPVSDLPVTSCGRNLKKYIKYYFTISWGFPDNYILLNASL
jgi:hypothetical protein